MTMYIQNVDFIIEWNGEKNQLLKTTRKVCFEDVENAIRANKIIETRPHHSPTTHPHQQIIFIEINNYVYAVPFVKTNQGIYLKTIYPTRKATKQYKKKGLIL